MQNLYKNFISQI